MPSDPKSQISNLISPRPGIFAKTFPRSSLDEVLDAVRDHGFSTVQFNFACAGFPSLPGRADPSLLHKIRLALHSRHLHMAAVSGTCNMIHPDPAVREDGLRRLHHLIALGPELDTPMVTLCTGTRDPDNMWRHHPGNDRADAWRDLRRSLDQALSVATDHDMILGVEPEIGNVLNSAAKARQLLDEFQSPHLKIILDPANLVRPETLDRQQDLIREAFQLLGPDLAMAHAKEIGPAGHPDESLALGQGRLEWNSYLDHLRQAGFTGPLIIHGCREDAVPQSLRFLQNLL